MLANIVFETFEKGGPIMWPILVTFTVCLAVVCERVFWWWRERFRRDHKTLNNVFDALNGGDYETASRQAHNSKDPLLRMVYQGLHHASSSLVGAMQMAAGIELQRAGRFLGVLDTIVTLAPLLGLLGTVTGIMHSFKFVGNEELAAVKVSGGIAEALIATACGLGIAIFALIPFNYYTRKLANLQFELETTMNNVDLLVQSAKQRGYDTQIFRRESQTAPV
ncbi:MAG TPA: MotA/TolQ/ExbB proton channel family protein [Verrucomicrobiae bacterium]|jgi:biopolymer transport protein ExbB